jgi:adenylate kinase
MLELEEKAKEEFEAAEKKRKKVKGEVYEAKPHIPRIPDDLLYRIVEHKLSDNLCKNKGYILEGYPKSFNDAKSIFEHNTDELPNFVFKLVNYTDDLLKNRIKLSLDPSLPVEHHFTDEAINKRLHTYQIAESHESITSFFSKFSNVDVQEIDCQMHESELIDICKAKIEKVNVINSDWFCNKQSKVRRNGG